MKRLFLALGLMLGLGLMLPTAASAITCQKYGPGWPAAYVQYCTNVTQNQASEVVTALNNAPGQTTVTKLNGVSTSLVQYMTNLNASNSALGTFYVFNNDQDFETWAGDTTNPNSFKSKGVGYPTLAEIRTAGGVTGDTPTVVGGTKDGNPLYTIVFLNVDYGGSYAPNTAIGNAGAHELGHWIDALFAATTKATASNGVASSSYFQQELTDDWAAFNQFPSCPGVFTNLADQTGLEPAGKTYYICAGTNGNGSGYNGIYKNSPSNHGTLSNAWNHIYGSKSNELLAEEYGGGSMLDGQNDTSRTPLTQDAYLGYFFSQTSFQCSRLFLSYLVQHNAVPLKANPPANWPSACTLF
ncbi:MAG TPA: hypothetical protein V6C97_18725 [Oculatellaceae cyanobacterium]